MEKKMIFFFCFVLLSVSELVFCNVGVDSKPLLDEASSLKLQHALDSIALDKIPNKFKNEIDKYAYFKKLLLLK